MKKNIKCRFCGSKELKVFLDLGSSPLANSYIKPEDEGLMEPYYPLCVYVCSKCLLVQLPEHEKAVNIFSDYAYFSSYSESWLKHSEEYARMIIKRLRLGRESQVVEIASNDGYLLQYFKEAGVGCYGVDPAKNVAVAARDRGIETIVDFFGEKLAKKLTESRGKADLIIGNNVFAHVPDVNDLVGGMKIILKPSGVITMEFPHLLQLIKHRQFDTIYHEHYSYYSLITAMRIFESHGLEIFDVDELSTHGGSMRIYAKHKNNDKIKVGKSIGRLLRKESKFGLDKIGGYAGFSEEIVKVKCDILTFLIKAKRHGKRVVGYGAAAKGNTFLNYCGIKTDFIDYVVDKSPHKQGCYLPGTRIPIFSPEQIFETKPNYILILPWNLKDEITEQMKEARKWGAKFVVGIPNTKII